MTALSADERGQLLGALADKWSGYVQTTFGSDAAMWRDRLTRRHIHADAAHLRQALEQETYEAAMATLIGRGSAAGSDTGSRLGDRNGDLTYTPITPCRIVDTRLTPGGPIAGNSTRGFFAVDEVTFASQGGAAGNCGTLGVLATAVAINVTAVAPAQDGYATVQPWGAGAPVTASLNFSAGSVVNNTVIAQIPFPPIALDFGIFSFATAHYVVDIVGYFAPPVATALECIDQALPPFNVPAGGAAVSTAPFCPASYTQTATNCEAFLTTVVISRARDGNCAYYNPSGQAVLTHTSRTCCRVPGR